MRESQNESWCLGISWLSTKTWSILMNPTVISWKWAIASPKFDSSFMLKKQRDAPQAMELPWQETLTKDLGWKCWPKTGDRVSSCLILWKHLLLKYKTYHDRHDLMISILEHQGSFWLPSPTPPSNLSDPSSGRPTVAPRTPGHTKCSYEPRGPETL